MRLMLDTSAVTFQVTKPPEPRRDYGKTEQKVDRDTGQPQWVVEVLAQDADRGEVIKVTVTGDQPKVSPGQPVRFKRAILQPMQHSACGALPGVRGGLGGAVWLLSCAEVFLPRLAAPMPAR